MKELECAMCMPLCVCLCAHVLCVCVCQCERARERLYLCVLLLFLAQYKDREKLHTKKTEIRESNEQEQSQAREDAFVCRPKSYAAAIEW